MNSPSEDIKDILESSGLGLIFATNLFVGALPAQSQDNCVVIYDTPGFPQDLTFDPDETYYRPSIQVMVRHRSYQQAYDLIHDIRIELHGLGHEVWNGTTYELIRCAQDPFHLGADEKNRERFVCNFDIQRH